MGKKGTQNSNNLIEIDSDICLHEHKKIKLKTRSLVEQRNWCRIYGTL